MSKHPLGGWISLKLLRTGTDGKTEAAQMSCPFLGGKDGFSLQHLDSCGFWLQDLL